MVEVFKKIWVSIQGKLTKYIFALWSYNSFYILTSGDNIQKHYCTIPENEPCLKLVVKVVPLSIQWLWPDFRIINKMLDLERLIVHMYVLYYGTNSVMHVFCVERFVLNNKSMLVNSEVISKDTFRGGPFDTWGGEIWFFL